MIQNLNEEFKKYTIPNETIELLEWIMNGDKNGSKYGWDIYKRTLLSSVETLNHYYFIIEELLPIFQGRFDLLIYKHIDGEKALINFLNNENEQIWKDIIELYKMYKKTENFNILVKLKSPFEDAYSKSIDELFELKTKEDDIKKFKEQCENFEYLLQIFENDNNKDAKRALIQKLDIKGLKTKGIIKKKTIQKIEELNLQIINYEKEYELQNKEIKTKLIEICKEALDKIKPNEENNLNTVIYDNILAHVDNLNNDPNAPYDKVGVFIKNIANIHPYLEKHMNLFIKDIRANARITREMFHEVLLNENDFEKLCRLIRHLIINSNSISDHKLSKEYRTETLNNNDGFIKGANLSQEEIKTEMAKLNERFAQLKQIENPEEYIRKSIDLYQDFITLHPYLDGNGRTSRLLLEIILAKKEIILPGFYDTYYERGKQFVKNSFPWAGDMTASTGDYKYIEDYIIHRIQQFNPNIIKIVTEESIRLIANNESKEKVIDLISNIPTLLEGKDENNDQSRTGERSH